MPVKSSAIRVLSAGAPKLGVRRCAETFARKTGITVDIEFAPAPEIRGRIERGESAADIIVAPVGNIEQYIAAGQVVEGTGTTVGAVSAGVAVREGAPRPDLSSADSLKQALLDADTVIYNTASSGAYIEKLIAQLGIADALAGKTERFPNGAAVMVRLAEGTAENEIGFGQVTEILRFEGGVTLAGPLAEEIGNTTDYAAGLLAAAGANDNARALIDFMGSGEAKRIYAEAGLA